MNIIKKIGDGTKKIMDSRICLSIQGGLAFSGPFTLIGSLILLILNFLPAAANEWMTRNWNLDGKAVLNLANYTIFSMNALWISFGIAAIYVGMKNAKEKAMAGLAGLMSFTILTMRFSYIEGVLTLQLTEAGSDGILTAMLCGLLCGVIYDRASKQIQGSREKGKEATTESSKALELVMESFRALWPVSSCILAVLGLRIFGELLLPDSQTIALWISSIIQKPFSKAADQLAVLLGLDAAISVLDWCGLSGTKTMETITTPLGRINKYANQALMDSGQVLILGQNAAYFTGQYQFFSRGAVYSALVIAVLAAGRDKAEKTRAKTLLVPAIFNITAVIRYTLPVVFQLRYLLPVILCPVVSNIMVYAALSMGFIQPFGVMAPPWTTPYLIYGFLVSGWRGLVLQLVILLVNILIYLPFVWLGNRKQKS